MLEQTLCMLCKRGRRQHQALVLGVMLLTLVQPVTQAQNLPVQIEALLGTTWAGRECCGWTFGWNKMSTVRFRGNWSNPNGETYSTDNIVINIYGDNRVRIERDGGSSAGGCTYEGNIQVGRASGTYSCRGSGAGSWSATIR